MSAVEELEALRGRVEEAERRVQEVAAAEKMAKAELREARVGLAEVEADGTAKQVEAARQRLERARVAVEHDPWSERRKLAQGRIAKAVAAVVAFQREHLLELADELGEEADATAAAVDEAGRRFLEACHARHAAQERLTNALHPALNGAGRYVARSRADRARLAVEGLLEEGEAPPRLDIEAARLVERAEVA